MHGFERGVATALLTPYELQNTLGDLFEIDYGQYNPLIKMYHLIQALIFIPTSVIFKPCICQ